MTAWPGWKVGYDVGIDDQCGGLRTQGECDLVSCRHDYADRAENSEIWDMEGRRYIDFAGGIVVVNTGHRHQESWLPSKRSSTASRTPATRSCPMRTMSGSADRLNAIVPGTSVRRRCS